MRVTESFYGDSPTKHVATFGWDLTNNKIELGQWFYGRIYEHRSSLSHDGKYFLYAAMNCKWDSETGGIWAAVSKTPYIKAIETLLRRSRNGRWRAVRIKQRILFK